MHEPFGGEIGRGADREDAGALTLQQSLRTHVDAVERIAHHGKIAAPRFGDGQTLPLPIEELDAELGFQGLDLMADGALSYTELFCRPREALIPCGGLEGPKRIERWQT